MSGDLFKGLKPLDFIVPFRHGIHNPTPGAIVTDNLRKSYGLPTGNEILGMFKGVPAPKMPEPTYKSTTIE